MNKFSLALLLLITACSSFKGKEDYSTQKDLPYKGTLDERQMADVWIPKGKGPFPGVILVHGGGWSSRTKKDMDSIAVSLASHGIIAFNINYRLSPKDHHPAPIDDLESAVEYFKSRAQDFKLDTNRLGLWGYSSGGHTVTYYALTRAQDPDLKVNAVVAGGTPHDFTWYDRSPYIKGYMGNYRDKMLKDYFAASTTSHITKDAPAFYLYHAENDKLVEYAQMMAFEARLKEQNIFVKSHRVPFWGHTTTFLFSDRAVEKGINFLWTIF